MLFSKKLKISINYFCFRLINYSINMCWSGQGTILVSEKICTTEELDSMFFFFFFNYSISKNWWIFAEKKTFNTEKYCYPCGSGFKVIDWNDPKKQYRLVFFFNFKLMSQNWKILAEEKKNYTLKEHIFLNK
jgi:hypothetical protein